MASSLPGITISIPSGSEFVSTRAITGMPIFFASKTAIFSYFTSITNIASGRPFMSLMPPTLASNFVYSFWISTASFLISFSILPEEIISSISCNLLMEPLIVFQLVKVPPNHLLLTYGNPIAEASSFMVLLADLFVPTKSTLLPFEQISSTFDAAAFKCSWVISKLIILICFLVSKIYCSIFGFHLLTLCPKCTPASSKSSILTSGRFIVFSGLTSTEIKTPVFSVC